MPKSLNLKRGLAFGISFLFAFTQGILLPLYPYLANELNLSLSLVIFCFSAGTLLFACTSPFWASKSERRGALSVMTIGVAGLLFSLSIIAFVFLFPPEAKSWALGLLLFSRVLYGLTASGINPVSQSIHAKVSKNSSKPMILHSLCLNSGRLLGFTSLFFLIDSLSLIFMGILFCLTLSFIFGITMLVFQNEAVDLPHSLPKEKLNLLGIHKKPFFVALCFSIYLELINSSLAGRIQNTFMVSGKEAAEQSAVLFLLAVSTIVVVQIGLIFLKEISAEMGKFVGVLFLTVGGILFGLFQSQYDLYLSVFIISLGLAMVPAFNLADLKQIFGLKGYARRAGWMASFYTTGYAVGGVLAALAFKFSQNFFLLFIMMMGAILLILCFPVRPSKGETIYG